MAPRLPLLAGLAAGGFAAYRALTWRRRLAAARADVDAGAAPDLRAEELRRKLDEVKGLEAEREGEQAGEIPIDRAEAPADLDARRRAVHERGRTAAEQMRAPDAEPPSS